MPTALVLDSGSGPALAAIRSLGRAGWKTVVAAGTRAVHSRYASVDEPIPDAAADVDGFVRGVVSAVERHDVDIVAPTTDASVEVLWSIADQLGKARILGGDRASAERATDKVKGLVTADTYGFPTPPWAAPATVDEAVAALELTGLPAVVKPRRSYVRDDGGLRQRRHDFVREPSELEPLVRALAEADGTLPLVQAFVPGRSMSVTAVVQQGRIVAAAARETLSFDPIAGGTSVWKRTVPPDDVGVQQALQLLLSMGYEGLAEVEYQVDAGGTPRLMEIGVRLHGWVPLAVHAGVDLPLLAARALLGEQLPESVGYRVGVEMRWPSGELGRIRAALDRRRPMPPGVRRRDVLAKAWPPWRPGMTYDGVVLSDLGPWLGFRTRKPPAAR